MIGSKFGKTTNIYPNFKLAVDNTLIHEKDFDDLLFMVNEFLAFNLLLDLKQAPTPSTIKYTDYMKSEPDFINLMSLITHSRKYLKKYKEETLIEP